MRRKILLIVLSFVIAIIIYSCQDAHQIRQDIYYVNGRDLYIKHCQNCHGDNGEGLNALAPPLTDTLFLKQNKEKIACYIKNGVSDKLTVHGKVYQEKMPDFPNLANIDLAQIIVYITNSFGNKQDHYTPEQVAADLKNCN